MHPKNPQVMTVTTLLTRVLVGLAAAAVFGGITWSYTRNNVLTVIGAILGLVGGFLVGGRIFEAIQ